MSDLITLMESRAKGEPGDVSASLLSKALEQIAQRQDGADKIGNYVEAATLCIKRCSAISETHFKQLDAIKDMKTRMELADAMIEHAPKLTMLMRSKDRHFSPDYTEMHITPFQRWERLIGEELEDETYRSNDPFQRLTKAADFRHMAHDALSATEFYNLTKMVIDKERRFIRDQTVSPMQSYTRALLDKIEQQRIQACMHHDDVQAYTWRVVRYNLLQKADKESYFLENTLKKKYFPELKQQEATPDPRAEVYARGR